MQSRALGRKVSDEFAVPLCRAHHRAAHHTGDERAWWAQVGIDPIKVARELWSNSRLSDGHSQNGTDSASAVTALMAKSEAHRRNEEGPAS
jgi:hypothetical protein